MKPQLVYSLLLVIATTAAIAPPVGAVEAESIPPTPLEKGGNLLSPTPLNQGESILSPTLLNREKGTLSPSPLKKGGAAGGGISGFMAQQSSITQVTNVQLQQTDKGLTVILETAEGESLQVFPTSFGKTFVANIPNAQLVEAKTFRQENPASGIASIAVTQQGTNNIRITVTGIQDLPQVEIGRSDRALTLTLPGAIAPTAQQPAPPAPVAPTPEAETTPEETPPQEEATPPTDGIQPPATTTEGEEQEVVVTGEQETGYSVPDTSTATKTDTELRDIPQSIQVVPRQLLEDRNTTRLGDALQTVPGISSLEGGYEGYGEYYQIRGFFGRDFFRDGIATDVWATVETANLERIEVLKGPASVLFGQGSPGGIINLVTKKPLAEPYYSISGTIGSFDTYRGELDFSGPLNNSGTVKYRLNIAYENNGSFFDFVEGERFFIAPVITWDIGSRTSLTVDASYFTDSRTPYYGIPAVGRRIADVPRSRYYGESFNEYDFEGFELGAVLRHGFSDNWSVTGAFRYQDYSQERYAVFFDSPDETTGEITRETYFSDGDYRRYVGNIDVVGEFKTGSIQHKLLLGTEYRQYIEDPRFQTGEPYPSINLFAPVYINRRFDKVPTFFRDDYNVTWGFYVQDQIDLLPNLKFLAGVRYDSYKQYPTEQNLGEPRNDFEQTDTAWSPRVGIVYQPIEPISLYFSYSESFVPNFDPNGTATGQAFDPEKGRQFEVGVKADLNSNLNATLALFDIKKQNVLTSDPNNPDFSIQTGEQTSRGIELGVTGEILPGWNIYASYTYLDAFISEDNTYEVGNRLDNVPESSIGLWTKYEIQEGGLRGLGFGLGLYYVGDRFGNLDNTIDLPSYFRTDLALYYERDNWKAQINFRNLFDIDYEAGTDGGTSIAPGTPFTVSGTLSVEF